MPAMPSPWLTAALGATTAALLLWHARRRRRRHLARRLISDAQWDHFMTEGYVVLPPEQVFAAWESDIKALQDRLDEICMGTAKVPYGQMMMQLDSTTGEYGQAGEQTLGFKGPTLRYRKIQNLDRDDLVMRYLRRPVLREACQRVYGPETPISSFRTMFFNKPKAHGGGAPGGTRLPWHQDRWRYLDRDPLLNVYLALDPATPASGNVRIIPRSHTWGVLNPDHHSAFLTQDQAAKWCGEHAPMPIRDLVLRVGEVALIHNWVVHCSGVNATDRPRRALSVSFMDARTALDETEFGGFLGGEHKSSGYPEGGMNFPLIFEAS
jgi:phytanoyl-CoA hydroxylase